MANFEKDKLIQIPRPELGRPTDPRLTPEYIAARPELERAGYPAFDPTRDIDYHGYIEGALQWLQSLASYATPEVAAQVETTLAEAQKTLAETAQNLAAQNQRLAALNLPPWAVTDNQPGYVEITQLRAGAVRPGTVTLPNSGITLPTVEVDLA